jgi:hypothetical protein
VPSTPTSYNTLAPAHVQLPNNGQILHLKCENMQVALWHKQASASQSKNTIQLSYGPAAGKKLNPQCHRACSGINLLMSSGDKFASSCLKLNSGGNGRPFGNLAWGSRNSSKNECAHASRAVHRRFGAYWRRRDARSIASGGIRLWKILCHG